MIRQERTGGLFGHFASWRARRAGSRISIPVPPTEEVGTMDSEARRLHRMVTDYARAEPPKHTGAPENPFVLATAETVGRYFESAVIGLSEFPHGLSFPKFIFHYTGHMLTDGRGRQGELVSTVNENGEMIMMEAYSQNDLEEWDLRIATQVPTTHEHTLLYAIPLLDTISNLRLAAVMLPVAIKEGDGIRVEKIKKDLVKLNSAKENITNSLVKALYRATQISNQTAKPTG